MRCCWPVPHWAISGLRARRTVRPWHPGARQSPQSVNRIWPGQPASCCIANASGKVFFGPCRSGLSHAIYPTANTRFAALHRWHRHGCQTTTPGCPLVRRFGQCPGPWRQCQQCQSGEKQRPCAKRFKSLAAHLQRPGIDDIAWHALDEIDHVVKCSAVIQLVAVLLDIADVGRANTVLQPQQGMTLQNRL